VSGSLLGEGNTLATLGEFEVGLGLGLELGLGLGLEDEG
jgi:hypothetical protein